jgi:anaerobic magnesium-protoporphyrin IX monomethyl ester cyclase
MRIALIYPPPWKIPTPGYGGDPDDGPPDEYADGDLDTDFYQIPYGLLSLAANAIRAGHQVKVLNLSNRTWSDVEQIIAQLDAQLFGLSCWTANRRGVELVSTLIKRNHPGSYVVIGGPHATPLAKPILERWSAVDCVVLGEGEITFLELAERLQSGQSTSGLAGALAREQRSIVAGPKRPAVTRLDDLASVQDYFSTHILMTSRGCPWNCTFCGAETSWGRGFRSLSVPRVLDAIQEALERVQPRILLIKDDTFTANKRRVLDICTGIRERSLNFSWSCDTRVDVLDDELLRAMRLAGCERLSLGVESGSPEILRNINKRITVEQIIKSADAARRCGIRTRFYMMLGNRGETEATFLESLRFLERARPSSYIFSCLSIYPGTDDYDDAVKSQRIDPQAYFDEKFQELKIPFDASDADAKKMNTWFHAHRGVQPVHVPNVTELREVLANLGDHHAAHLDLAEALVENGDFEAAELHLARAEALGSPTPGLILNARACIAARQADYPRLKDLLIKAAQRDPQHYLLLTNAALTKAWFKAGHYQTNQNLELEARHDFQLFERTLQPMLPGELPRGWADWGTFSTVAPAAAKAGLNTDARVPRLEVIQN